MNLKPVFDVVLHMQEKATKGTDFTFGDITLDPDQQDRFVRGAIQAFMHNTGMGKDRKGAIQAFSGAADLPKLTENSFSTTQEADQPDLGWQRAFKTVTLGDTDLAWEIPTVDKSITFELIPEGAKVKIQSLKGDTVTIKIQKYGAGLGVTWEMVRGRKLYQFAQKLELARSAMYELWANIHYGILQTAGATNTLVYQAGTTQIEKDIATINAAALKIATDNKDKQYGDLANARMLMYAPLAMRPRMISALGATAAQLNPSKAAPQVVSQPIEPIFTLNSKLLATKFLLVLPGRSIQNGIVLQEASFSRQEIESLSEVRTYWTAFGAGIGNAKQVVQADLS